MTREFESRSRRVSVTISPAFCTSSILASSAEKKTLAGALLDNLPRQQAGSAKIKHNFVAALFFVVNRNLLHCVGADLRLHHDIYLGTSALGKARAAAKMKIVPGNLGILHSVCFNAADKQFPDDYND